MDWVDTLIDLITKAIDNGGKLQWTDQSGSIMTAKVEVGLLQLIQDNRARLSIIGQDTFKEAMLLISKQQEFDALVLIYEKLDNSELVEQFKTDSVKLAELAIQAQQNRAFWLNLLKQSAFKIIAAGLGALL
jgi:hypothetical protein